MKSYFRPAIDVMSGYTPGEQPKMKKLVKLNTNENPFPPAPGVAEVLKKIDYDLLRRYPDPMADELCGVAAKIFGLERNNIIGGNGSDDILTMTFRAFSDPVRPVAVLNPTYSLYDELAKMQEAELIKISLEDDFSLPEDLLEQAERANLLIITRPNAPSGNTFPLEKIREFCQKFDGIVFIDEAYGDF
ncbi:MAG: aminotransferase class I/II-fold pyridoxal phosphate-dependent enzyme, partial [Victivallaceae bacterium]